MINSSSLIDLFMCLFIHSNYLVCPAVFQLLEIQNKADKVLPSWSLGSKMKYIRYKHCMSCEI